MNVFVSWSGEQSRRAAEALRWWLPMVINAVEPWLSTLDIDQGATWFAEIADQLSTTHYGIFCLTRENLQAPWLLFEAGALWKGQNAARPCAYLIGLSKADVGQPLAQFQLTEANREDTWKLVQTLNGAIGTGALAPGRLEIVFDVWWPKLNERLVPILSEPVGRRAQRKDRELLEELLQLVRDSIASRTTPTEYRRELSAVEAEVQTYPEPLRRAALLRLLYIELSQTGNLDSGVKAELEDIFGRILTEAQVSRIMSKTERRLQATVPKATEANVETSELDAVPTTGGST